VFVCDNSGTLYNSPLAKPPVHVCGMCAVCSGGEHGQPVVPDMHRSWSQLHPDVRRTRVPVSRTMPLHCVLGFTSDDLRQVHQLSQLSALSQGSTTSTTFNA